MDCAHGYPTHHVNVVILEWDRWVTPPKAVTSPSWSPPPPWKQAPGPFPSWKNFHNWRVFGLRKPGYNKWRWDCLRGQNQNGGRQLTGGERYKTTFFRRYKPPNKRKCIRRDRISGKWLFLGLKPLFLQRLCTIRWFTCMSFRSTCAVVHCIKNQQYIILFLGFWNHLHVASYCFYINSKEIFA